MRRPRSILRCAQYYSLLGNCKVKLRRENKELKRETLATQNVGKDMTTETPPHSFVSKTGSFL